MHASRTFSDAKYLVSAAVLLTELLKLAACVAFAALRPLLAEALGMAHTPTHAGPADWLAAAVDGVTAAARGMGSVAVPAVLVRGSPEALSRRGLCSHKRHSAATWRAADDAGGRRECPLASARLTRFPARSSRWRSS